MAVLISTILGISWKLLSVHLGLLFISTKGVDNQPVSVLLNYASSLDGNEENANLINRCGAISKNH